MSVCDPSQIWPWYSDPEGPYDGALPVWIEEYRTWTIWDLTEVEPGAHTYGASDPSCVGQNYFTSSLDGIRTRIDEWIGPAIATSLTLNAPDTVDLGEPFTINGNLYETDTSQPLAGQQINISYNGTPLGHTFTSTEGFYYLDISINQEGNWLLKADFTGTLIYAKGTSSISTMVAITPLQAAIKIIASAVTGIALLLYGLK